MPRFKLAGVPATAAGIVVANSTLTVILRGDGVEGKWHLRPGHEAITSVIEVEGATTDVGVEVWLPFPSSAAIHHLTGQNWSARIDASCPLGAAAGVALGSTRSTHQLAAVEVRGLCDHRHRLVRIHALPARHTRRDLEYRGVSGYPGTLVGYRVCERSTVGAIRTILTLLRRLIATVAVCNSGSVFCPRAHDASVPSWLDEIKVLVSLDLWRETGEIAHTFDHVVALCQDLADLGVSSGTAIHLQGFQGPSGSRYPVFDPAPELGGSAGLRAVTEAVHAGGHRLMVQSNVWGLDPYAEGFAPLEHLALPYDRPYERLPGGQVGPYEGWPGAFPVIPTGYDSGFVALQPQVQSATQVTFETLPLPNEMEAFLTIAGVQDCSYWCATGSRQWPGGAEQPRRRCSRGLGTLSLPLPVCAGNERGPAHVRGGSPRSRSPRSVTRDLSAQRRHQGRPRVESSPRARRHHASRVDRRHAQQPGPGGQRVRH